MYVINNGENIRKNLNEVIASKTTIINENIDNPITIRL